MIIDTPFRRAITPSSFTRRSRGTLAGYKHKLHNLILFPTISIASTWRGASEIVATLEFDGSTNVSFFDNVPTNPNYCAVISWIISPGVRQRYKLWEDVGEILYVSLYSGQIIPDGAVIEIWNTPSTPTVVEGFSIKTSILTIPDCNCDNTDRTTNAVYVQCTDITFDLTNFDPSVGDYYVLLGCGVTELIHAGRLSHLTLFCPDDSTWHDFTFFNFGGTVLPLVDQANSAPAAKEYFPLIGIDEQVHKMEILLAAGIYTYTIGGTVIDPTGVINVQLLSTDANYYLLSLSSDLTDIVIDQNPIP